MSELDDVRRRMLELEAAEDKPDGSDPDPYGMVAAKLLGIEWSEEFDEALDAEARRALHLAANASMRHGIPFDARVVSAIAFVQGITFAAAAREVGAPLAEREE